MENANDTQMIRVYMVQGAKIGTVLRQCDAIFLPRKI